MFILYILYDDLSVNTRLTRTLLLTHICVRDLADFNTNDKLDAG
jgi:hypothetical protein